MQLEAMDGKALGMPEGTLSWLRQLQESVRCSIVLVSLERIQHRQPAD